MLQRVCVAASGSATHQPQEVAQLLLTSSAAARPSALVATATTACTDSCVGVMAFTDCSVLAQLLLLVVQVRCDSSTPNTHTLTAAALLSTHNRHTCPSLYPGALQPWCCLLLLLKGRNPPEPHTRHTTTAAASFGAVERLAGLLSGWSKQMFCCEMSLMMGWSFGYTKKNCVMIWGGFLVV